LFELTDATEPKVEPLLLLEELLSEELALDDPALDEPVTPVVVPVVVATVELAWASARCTTTLPVARVAAAMVATVRARALAMAAGVFMAFS